MSTPTTFEEAYKTFFGYDDQTPRNSKTKDRGAKGIIEIIIRDKRGNVVEHYFEPNIVKIFAKEMLAHRLPASEIWDVNANSGSGGWVASEIDVTEEFAARYILFGASFDENGVALDTNDPRYYTIDETTGQPVPIRLSPGADYDGGLINAIPLSEPARPLKRIEAVGFQATFQPAGNPLLQSDVRGMNNIVTLQTTLRLNEYNGLGVTESDFFTITEIALAGGKKFDAIGQCDCDPRTLFLQGATTGSTGTSGVSTPIPATANGNDVVTLDAEYADAVKEGDQIKLVGSSDTAGEETISQVTPFYLVISKAAGGRDCQLDRVPVHSGTNSPIIGNVGVYRDTLRLFSHRILNAPIKKSADFEIQVIWRIIFS
jgi:hypothetical protein